MSAGVELCPNCGNDSGDNWFDRTFCPCQDDDMYPGVMHTRCSNCGHALDGCDFDKERCQNLLLQADRALWKHRQAFARIAASVDGERARLIAQEALRDEETAAVTAAIALARAGL